MPARPGPETLPCPQVDGGLLNLCAACRQVMRVGEALEHGPNEHRLIGRGKPKGRTSGCDALSGQVTEPRRRRRADLPTPATPVRRLYALMGAIAVSCRLGACQGYRVSELLIEAGCRCPGVSISELPPRCAFGLVAVRVM